MHADLWALPTGLLAVGLTLAQTSSAEWAPVVGPVSAAGAVIWTVQVFIRRQALQAKETSDTMQMIVAAHEKAMSSMIARLDGIDGRVSDLGGDVARLVERGGRAA